MNEIVVAVVVVAEVQTFDVDVVDDDDVVVIHSINDVKYISMDHYLPIHHRYNIYIFCRYTNLQTNYQ